MMMTAKTPRQIKHFNDATAKARTAIVKGRTG